MALVVHYKACTLWERLTANLIIASLLGGVQALEVGLPLVGHLVVDIKLFVGVVWQNFQPCVKSAARNGFIGRVCIHSSLRHAQSCGVVRSHLVLLLDRSWVLHRLWTTLNIWLEGALGIVQITSTLFDFEDDGL